MDKLEHYLDQVCRGIGGPRALRHHIRRELWEHLRDAVAVHKAAGLTEEEALARALADFGQPEEVRSELEATHGHRLMAVVIDKALEWKEKTMKAKWLWTTWAHLVLAIVVALEVAFISFALVFIVPKFKMFVREGWIGLDRTEPIISWVPGFLSSLDPLYQGATWLLIGSILSVILFEWRVKSESKTMMRLSALSTAALGLFILFVAISVALVLPLIVGLPEVYARAPEPIVDRQMTYVETSLKAAEEAKKRNDWGEMREKVLQAAQAVRNLNLMGAAGPSLVSLHERPKIESVRTHLKAAERALWDARDAIIAQDDAKLEAALKKFEDEYGPVREAAKAKE